MSLHLSTLLSTCVVAGRFPSFLSQAQSEASEVESPALCPSLQKARIPDSIQQPPCKAKLFPRV